MSNSKDMVKVVYAALEEKQGKDISIMDIGGVSVIADYFVIATADMIPAMVLVMPISWFWVNVLVPLL